MLRRTDHVCKCKERYHPHPSPSQLPVHYEGRRVPKSDPFCTEVSFHDVWAFILYKALVGRRVYLGAPFCTSLNQKLCFPRGFHFVLDGFLNVVSFWLLYELSSYDSIWDVSKSLWSLPRSDRPSHWAQLFATAQTQDSCLFRVPRKWALQDVLQNGGLGRPMGHMRLHNQSSLFCTRFSCDSDRWWLPFCSWLFLGSMMRDPILY